MNLNAPSFYDFMKTIYKDNRHSSFVEETPEAKYQIRFIGSTVDVGENQHVDMTGKTSYQVEIVNSGSMDLPVKAVKVYGKAFEVSGLIPEILAAGTNYYFTVLFDPIEEGRHQGFIQFITDPPMPNDTFYVTGAKQ